MSGVPDVAATERLAIIEGNTRDALANIRAGAPNTELHEQWCDDLRGCVDALVGVAAMLAAAAETAQRQLAHFTESDTTITVGRQWIADQEYAVKDAEARAVAAEAEAKTLREALVGTANTVDPGYGYSRTPGLCWCGVSWQGEFVPDQHSEGCLSARAALAAGQKGDA